MTVLLSPLRVQRPRRLLALLALLTLVTGLSLSMTVPNRRQAVELDEQVLPSIRLVHEMVVAVDEARGLSALHLLRADAAEQRELERRLQAVRQRIERRLAASRQRLGDDTERGHFLRVNGRLAAYWSVQERLLAASRQAVDEPVAAAQARALLAGESQQAFQQLRAELDAWWAYTDRLAGLAQGQAVAQARLQLGLLGLQGLLALGALACVLVGRRATSTAPPQPPPGGAAAFAPPAAASDEAVVGAPGGTAPALDQVAFHARLLALNAAVVAARAGTTTPLSNEVEDDMRQLATTLGDTAARLRALVAGNKTGRGRYNPP
jgi:hypothetical protein